MGFHCCFASAISAYFYSVLNIYICARACVFECERKANVKNSAIEGSHQNHITSDSALSGLGQTKQNKTKSDHAYTC